MPTRCVGVDGLICVPMLCFGAGVGDGEGADDVLTKPLGDADGKPIFVASVCGFGDGVEGVDDFGAAGLPAGGAGVGTGVGTGLFTTGAAGPTGEAADVGLGAIGPTGA